MNNDHIEILKKGVQVWNQWRKDNPDIKPNLKGENLEDLNLTGVNFSETNLSEANLSEANLEHCNLENANFIGARLTNTCLGQTNLKNVEWGFEVPNEKEVLLLVAEQVLSDPQSLGMERYHSCSTVHCVAGWAFELDKRSAILEMELGPTPAAAIIFPNHHDLIWESDDREALEYLKHYVENHKE